MKTSMNTHHLYIARTLNRQMERLSTEIGLVWQARNVVDTFLPTETLSNAVHPGAFYSGNKFPTSGHLTRSKLMISRWLYFYAHLIIGVSN
jgi:hypothetical protein